MPLFLMGCFPVDFQDVKRPLRTKSVKRPIKVGKRPINEGKRPIKAKVLVGVSVGSLMGCFRAPPTWRKTAPLKRPIKRSMSLGRTGTGVCFRGREVTSGGSCHPAGCYGWGTTMEAATTGMTVRRAFLSRHNCMLNAHTPTATPELHYTAAETRFYSPRHYTKYFLEHLWGIMNHEWCDEWCGIRRISLQMMAPEHL